VLLAPSRRAAVRGRRAPGSGRALVLGTMLLVLAQAAVGVAVNLYATIPARHPGAHPASYLPGSFHSVVWAIGHGETALAAHAALGLALAVLALAVPIRLLRAGRGAAALCSLVAAALVIGAGFNGASFLDFSHDSSSLIMALLAFAAIAVYGITLTLLDR
jgi:hypothetical protein